MNNNEEKRTEEDIVTQEPIKVVFKGKTYDVPILVILHARPWRRRVSELLVTASGTVGTTSDDPESFKTGLNSLLVDMPDTIIDLFFEYARDLDRDEIESVATESEMATAFSKILEVAFPLATTLALGVAQPTRATRRKNKP